MMHDLETIFSVIMLEKKKSISSTKIFRFQMHVDLNPTEIPTLTNPAHKHSNCSTCSIYAPQFSPQASVKDLRVV